MELVCLIMSILIESSKGESKSSISAQGCDFCSVNIWSRELVKPSEGWSQSHFQDILCHTVNIVTLLCVMFSHYIRDTSDSSTEMCNGSHDFDMFAHTSIIVHMLYDNLESICGFCSWTVVAFVSSAFDVCLPRQKAFSLHIWPPAFT